MRWLGLTLALLAACGYASYYAHTNLEDDDTEPQQDTTISRLHNRSELLHSWRKATVGSTRVARLAGR